MWLPEGLPRTSWHSQCSRLLNANYGLYLLLNKTDSRVARTCKYIIPVISLLLTVPRWTFPHSPKEMQHSSLFCCHLFLFRCCICIIIRAKFWASSLFFHRFDLWALKGVVMLKIMLWVWQWCKCNTEIKTVCSRKVSSGTRPFYLLDSSPVDQFITVWFACYHWTLGNGFALSPPMHWNVLQWG